MCNPFIRSITAIADAIINTATMDKNIASSTSYVPVIGCNRHDIVYKSLSGLFFLKKSNDYDTRTSVGICSKIRRFHMHSFQVHRYHPLRNHNNHH